MKLSELKPWSQWTSIVLTVLFFALLIVCFFTHPGQLLRDIGQWGSGACVVALLIVMGVGRERG